MPSSGVPGGPGPRSLPARGPPGRPYRRVQTADLPETPRFLTQTLPAQRWKIIIKKLTRVALGRYYRCPLHEDEKTRGSKARTAKRMALAANPTQVLPPARGDPLDLSPKYRVFSPKAGEWRQCGEDLGPAQLTPPPAGQSLEWCKMGKV